MGKYVDVDVLMLTIILFFIAIGCFASMGVQSILDANEKHVIIAEVNNGVVVQNNKGEVSIIYWISEETQDAEF